MPTLKIDGREITVEPGTTILQAAQKIGIEIPTFCYHPGLSIAANCRMCLVDTNKAPKPLPACHAQVMDGMEVTTVGEKVEKTQRAVLEFILLNHPVDCLICDKAGECVLQDHYFKYSSKPSRLFHRKVHKPKAKKLGPDIILDAERCIMCTRCIRFCEEIAKAPQLTMTNRGEKTELTTFPGMELDNPYAGNTVDVCPVGALTSREFRFRTRVWFLSSEESVCPECERGCKIRVDTFENTVRRYKPMHNPKVNDWWMCDKGRGSFRSYLEERMEGPTVIHEGRRLTVQGGRALEDAAEALQSAGGMGQVAVVVTPWLTNEDAYLVGRLLKGALAGARVIMGGRAPGEGDDILIRPDKNPNKRGVTAILSALGVETRPLSAMDLSGVKTVVVLGDRHALTEAQLEALGRVDKRVVMGSFMGPLWQVATTFLPTRIHLEKDGTFTNFEGVVQRIRQAVKPAGTSKSEGYYAMKLLQAYGEAGAEFAGPRQIFAALAAEVPDFRGLSYENLGEFGQKLGEPPAPAAPEIPAPAMEDSP